MERATEVILSIPHGRVMSYGLVAAYAGNPRAARQVARLLHSSSKKKSLPWHRVVNKNGKISLKRFQGYERQRQLLKKEGILFSQDDAIDFKTCLWYPDPDRLFL